MTAWLKAHHAIGMYWEQGHVAPSGWPGGPLLADLWFEVSAATAAARYAADTCARGDADATAAAAIAQAYCSGIAVHAAEECVQLHGGIGFTWEHPAHLLLKRAKSGSMAFGTPDRHRAALARLADLPPAPAS